jgi:hypothetical protein
VHKRCWLALVWVLGCGDDDGGDRGQQSSAAATCARSCARAAAANCPNQPRDCQQLCEDQIMATPAACIVALNGYAACTSTAVFSCDAAGEAEATGCLAELSGWLTCANGGMQDATVSMPKDASAPDSSAADASVLDASDASAPDSAVSDAGGLSCMVEPADELCDQCLKRECCESWSACTGQCVELLACFQSCVGDDCATLCAAAYPGGLEPVTAINDCLETVCVDSCAEQP